MASSPNDAPQLKQRTIGGLEGTRCIIRAKGELFEPAHGQFGRGIRELFGDEFEQHVRFRGEERRSSSARAYPCTQQATARVVMHDRQCQQSGIDRSPSTPRVLHGRGKSKSSTLPQNLETRALAVAGTKRTEGIATACRRR
jgi:hypothetical protein